jgi:hypothetical protein
MYNPFSLLNTLKNGVFRDYWFETGTPSFLVHQLKKTQYSLEAMTTEELSTDTLNSIDIMDENPLPLLYQSGYLTLKSYDAEFGNFVLGFPNREVEQGFIKYLLPFYSPIDRSAQEALQQIEDKGYARPFAEDGRRLFKIGINFSTTSKLIDDWKIAD